MCFLRLHATHLWKSEDYHIYSMLTCLMARSQDRVTLPGYMEHWRVPHPPFPPPPWGTGNETQDEIDEMMQVSDSGDPEEAEEP